MWGLFWYDFMTHTHTNRHTFLDVVRRLVTYLYYDVSLTAFWLGRRSHMLLSAFSCFLLFVKITTLCKCKLLDHQDVTLWFWWLFILFFFFLCQNKLFDEKWHQMRLLVTEEDVTLYVDDLEIETLSLEPSVGIFINGKTQVGKYVSKETTVPVSLSASTTHFYLK